MSVRMSMNESKVINGLIILSFTKWVLINKPQTNQAPVKLFPVFILRNGLKARKTSLGH